MNSKIDMDLGKIFRQGVRESTAEALEMWERAHTAPYATQDNFPDWSDEKRTGYNVALRFVMRGTYCE